MNDAATFETTVTLKNGLAVTIRHLRPDDRDAVARAVAALDPESIYTRLFSYRPMTPAAIERIMQVVLKTHERDGGAKHTSVELAEAMRVLTEAAAQRAVSSQPRPPPPPSVNTAAKRALSPEPAVSIAEVRPPSDLPPSPMPSRAASASAVLAERADSREELSQPPPDFSFAPLFARAERMTRA